MESDEYAEISNEGSAPADIGGWRLNACDPGQACRVYMNESHPES